MAAQPECSNCGDVHRTYLSVCLIAAIGGVLIDRGRTQSTVTKLLKAADIDRIWEDLGRICDQVESGAYA